MKASTARKTANVGAGVETAPETNNTETKGKGGKPEFKLTAAQAREMGKLKGPSKQVRYLLSEGLTRSQICQVAKNARGEPIRYQHVRGIEMAMLAKQAKEQETTK